MNFLQQILAAKRKEIEQAKREVPVCTFHGQQGKAPSFIDAVRRRGAISLIAEIKKASPSRGIIRSDFNAVEIAKIYEANGAAAISVLTDKEYFQGDIGYIEKIRDVINLPLLRKDFIIDEYQLVEAKAAGASAVLLIVAALGLTRLEELMAKAEKLGLDSLVEIHNAAELQTALQAGAKIIGINNRNLKSFEVDLATTFALRPKIPSSISVISESGISTRQHVIEMQNAGVDAVLIGESLMAAKNIKDRMRELFP